MSMVATNLDIEQALLEEAVKVGGHPSKRAAVVEALKEYVSRRKQLGILNLFGTIEYDENYDVKKSRRKPCKS